MAIYISTPNGNGGSIWQSGRGPAADRQGNIYAVTGNGDYDGMQNFGESFVKVSAQGSATVDSYTPADWKSMSDNDFDLSAGPALITGTHIFIGADKMGNFYVINGDAMHQAGQCQHHFGLRRDPSSISPSGAAAETRSVYTQGGQEPVKCFQVTGNGVNPNPISTAANSIPYARIGMTLSANGGAGWFRNSMGEHRQLQRPERTGTLHAYDASNLANELWNSDMNPARDRMPPVAKFVAPTVANGKVYVPSFSNVVTVYGLLSPPADGGACNSRYHHRGQRGQLFPGCRLSR